MCEYCNESGALSTAKKAMEEVEKLKLIVSTLEEKFRVHNAYAEYKKMIKLGFDYKPDRETWKECDFAIIGDELICTNCHKSFYNEDYIPPYCPYCLAKRVV